MSKNISPKYYQKIRKDHKTELVKGIKVFLKKKRKK